MGTNVVRMDNTPRFSERVAARVQADIEASGLSVLQVSESAHIPRSTLQRRLTGTTPFTSDELASLASVLGQTVTDWAAAAEGCTTAPTAGAA